MAHPPSSLGAELEGALASAMCTVMNTGAAVSLRSCFQRGFGRFVSSGNNTRMPWIFEPDGVNTHPPIE
jgi:hypothetical protein